MAGALSDFARRPLGFKIGVFAAIAVVLGGGYYQFVFKKHRRSRDVAREDNAQLIARNNALDRDAKAYKVLLARSDELNRQIEENQKALPTESELPAFFDTLGRKVGDAGLEVRRWDYLKELPIETFVKVPIEIEISGTFYQLKRFFASLIQPGPAEPTPEGQPQERERIVTIENLTLFDPRVRNRELAMTAKFTASTFRQDQPAAAAEPKPPAAKPPAAKPPAAKPPAPGAGSALPPAASPAGAKARVENAMKADEERAAKGSPDKLKEGTP